MKRIFTFLGVILSTFSLAQTGPAGVGNTTGANGQPENIIWLDAGDIGVPDGADVPTWTDISGNGVIFSASSSGNLPSFSLNQVNGLPTVVFDDSNAERLNINPYSDMGTSEMSSIIVFATANSAEGLISYAVSGQSNEYLIYDAGAIRTFVGGPNSTGGSLNDGINTFNIFSSIWASAGGQLNHYKNGSNVHSATLSSGDIIGTGGSLTIGGEQDAIDGGYATNQDLEGEIAEIILFSNVLNDAQRTIIENYLSEKYAITISNDFFTLRDAAFTNDLMGIGTSDGSDKSSLSGFSDALQVEEQGSTLDASNEYLLLAHDNTAHAEGLTTDIVVNPGVLDSHWARSWFIEVSGGVSASLRFDFGTAGFGNPTGSGDYVLLYRATLGDNYTRIAANSYSIENTDQLVVDISTDLATGYYTLGEGEPITPGSWYSFQSGDWNDPLTWTTDPSGALRVPVTGGVPTATDNAVILSGRTVTMDTDDNDGVTLTVNGKLDIVNTSGHNFFNIAGNGTISFAGDVSNNDNFPSGSTSDFADATVGGTVEILGTGVTLNAQREFNNVIVNLTGASDVATLLSDYTINGDFTIQNGIFQINDNASTTALKIDAFGTVQVDASGQINVGTANARHEFNFYGDFTNSGTAEFTNRVAANNNNEATDGIVDANFLNDNADQAIDCNGTTNFYRIEIDKGSDETYILDINALSPANFNIFGPVDYGHGATAQLTTNDNALGLLRGTVRLNANVDVPLLNNTGNYNISVGARLWINGGSTTKTGGAAIVPYGIIQVSDGTLDVPVSSGITTRGNGSLIVSGGVVTINQFRTSVLGSENIGGYTQSGGTVNVTGQDVQQDYYTFSLTYPGNTFNMSGGTLRVAGPDTFNDNTGTSGEIHGGSIFIDSDPGNISVTGGTVIMENNTNINFKVTSKAPFWNVIMQSTGGTATEVDLDGGTSGDDSPGEFETITNPELLVLNDLVVGSGVSFDPNGNDIEVGSDLIIEDGAEWDVPLNTDPSAPYTLTLNGVDNSVLRLGNVKALADCGTCTAEWNTDQAFSSLVINKPDGIRVTLDASPEKDAVIAGVGPNSTFNNLVKVVDGTFDLQNGIVDIDIYSIRLETTDVRINGVLSEYEDGVDQPNANIKIRAATFTIQNTANAEIGNLVFRSNNDIVTLANDLYVKRMEFESGLLDLESNNLRVDILVNDLRASEANFGGCGGCYSVEDMIVTSGQASDGGISILIDGNGTYDFPFGVGTTKVEPASKYTPASVSISGFSDNGYITISPTDNILGTTAPTGDILSYYWRVDFEDFTSVPNVEYQFTYYDDDLDGSANESNFVAGKVLEIDPFTRNYEDDGVPENEGVDDTNNTIMFNGPTDSGFALEEASYTAGENTRFVGAPQIFYSINSSPTNWTNTNAWSLTRDGSAAGDYPQAGDIAILTRDDGGAGDPTSYGPGVFNINNGTGPVTIAKLIFDDVDPVNNNWISGCPRVTFDTNGSYAAYNSDFGTVEVTEAHIGGPTPNQSHGAVIQYNVNSSYTGIFPGGDFGNFNSYENALVIYTWDGGTGTATLSSDATEYPMLWFAGGNSSNRIIQFPDVDVTVNGRANINGNMRIRVNDDASRILTFKNNVEVGSGCCGSGFFEFEGNSTSDQTVIIEGNLSFNGTNGGQIRLVNNSATNTHNLAVLGNITVPNTGTINLGDGSNSVVELELTGEGDNTFSNTGSVTIHRIIMNKGNSKNNTFTFNDSFTLNGSTNTTAKAIEIQNGILVFNDAAINVDLTTGGPNFSIPSSGGLQVTSGTVNVSGDDSGISLDGCLVIDGGTVDMDDAVGNGNNFIEYSASGNALLEISSGTLDVGSQIRPITSAETGVLKYRQTGGDVRIGTQTAPENDRGMLQIYNSGSEFTYTGGTLTIERHQDSPTVAGLFLDPDDSDVTGSTITIFNVNTPAGQTDFRINSVIDLENLTINGTNTPSAEIDINPLTVAGDLTIASGATLNGNGITLTVGGDLDNDGTYDAQSNETIFNSTGTQQITGTGTNNFFRFTKSETGTLDLTSTLDVADLFTISAGILSDNGFSINLAGDAVIDGTHTSGAGNGLVFSGGPNQELRSTSAGTGTLGVVTIGNANGVTIPDGNGYNFNIDGGLRLDQGVFNVGGSEILLGLNAEIVAVSAFGVTNMIRTNSSFTDGGVGKVFPASYSTDFTFPVGQTFYTPVSFDFGTPGNSSGSTSGSIIVFPADEFHPTVNDGSDFFASGDINNVLQYYWTITSSGITGLTAQMTTGYDDSHVLSAEAGFDETDYIAARILTFDNPTDEINKFTVTDVNETTNIVSFDFSGVSDNGITGDYFAGIDEAIPDNVTTYTVDTDGNFGDDVYDILVPGGGAPTGAVVIVPNTFTLTLDVDNANFYRTEIQSGGVLEVDNSTNHRLGQLTGTGTLRILSDGINANLPAFSGNFLSCSGGGLEYGGIGSYSVLSGITELRNLTFSGSGTKTIANNNVEVCEDLIIAGPIVTIQNNRRLIVNGSGELNGGTLNAPSGGSSRFNVENSFTINSGNYVGGSSGQTNLIGGLTMNGGTFDVGSSTYIVSIWEDFDFNAGSFDGGDGNSELRIISLPITGRPAQNSTFSGSFVGSDAFNNLRINKSQSGRTVTFPGAVQVEGQLNLDDGLVFAQSGILLGSGASASPAIGKQTSYIIGSVSKELTSSGSTFNFPIGSTNHWRPASINNVSDAGLTWSVEYFEANPTTEVLVDNLDPTDPVQIATISDGEYWKISDDAGAAPPPGVTATVGLSWGAESNVSSVFAEREELEVLIWNDGISSWDNLDGTSFSAGHTQSEGRFTAVSSNSFSEQIFTLGSATAANALPIVLQKFGGETIDGSNYLEWVTSSEINNDYFELQRSADGIKYETIARLEGQGTTTNTTTYKFVDSSPLGGFNYYKLKQVDIDGTATTFNEAEWIVLLTITSEVEFAIRPYPNPTAQDNINVSVSLDQNLPLIIQVIDLFGKIVYLKSFEPGDLQGDFRIKPTQNLTHGMYMIIAEQNGKKLTKRVIISE